MPSAAAVMMLPTWMWGGDPTQLLDQADTICREQAPGPDGARRWRVQTQETYMRRRPELIGFRQLTGPGVRRPSLEYLGRADDDVRGDGIRADELARFADRARGSGQLVDMFNFIRLRLAAVPSAQLAGAAALDLAAVGEVTVEGDPDHRVFVDRALSVVTRSSALTWRLKLPSILHRLAHDPRMRDGDLSHVTAGDGALAFQSSSGLSDGAYLLDAYLGPLLACMTPLIWAVNAPRGFGNLVLTLGHPLAGTTGEAAELLQLIHVGGSDRPVAVPQLGATSSAAAVRWWASSLNDTLAAVSDFSVFVDAAGSYEPSRHLHAILTIEQLFRRVTSALVSDRDANARRVLMFTALDTLERLTSIKIERYADVDHARATLHRLETAIPAGAAEVLLPTARRAVVALEELSEGFFLARQLGRPTIEVPSLRGTQQLSRTAATAHYVKALRDATHGYGSNRANVVARTDALLAHHDGHIPPDLGLLCYLYLLDLMMQPDRLRSVMSRTS